jgi:hypothetical protein
MDLYARNLELSDKLWWTTPMAYVNTICEVVWEMRG